MNLALLAALCSISLLVASCSSSKALYPSKGHPWAKLIDEASCKRWWELYSQYPDFPAREAVILKLMNECELEEAELFSIWEVELPKMPTYIKEAILKRSYELALKKNLKEYAAGHAFELVSLADRQDQKIDWLTSSLALSKESGRADLAADLGELQKEVAPHLIKNPTPDLYFKVARDLERQRQFSEARKLYQKIIKAKDWDYKERLSSYDRYAMSFKLERDKETYTKETANTVKWLQGLKKRSAIQNTDLEERWMEWARAEWTQDRLEIGHLELTKLTRADFISDNAKAKSYWLLGMMERERNNLKLAYGFFELGSRITVTDADIKEKIEWAIAWNRFQAGEFEPAIESFARYLESTEDVKSETTLRFAYWLGMSYAKTSKFEKATEVWKEIIENNPVSYYSLLARKQLGIAVKPTAYQFPKNEELDLKASWLFYMKEYEVLKEYLSSSKNYDDVLDVTPFFFDAKAYRQGMLAGFRLQSSYDFEEISALLYPLAYQDIFSKAASKFSVPIHLLMGISRQESSFDTNARSFADAFGLLQVIPEKARQYGASAGVRYREIEDLYTPEINIPIAALMMKNLLANSEGHLVRAIASYNAGANPVSKWLETRFNGDWEQFVENIPYEETRKYVKLVLRNYLTYYSLSLKNEAPLPSDFIKSLN